MKEVVRFLNDRPEFMDELAEYLIEQGRVLEVFSGNGFLAKCLLTRGVQITPTSLFSGHDGHEFGMQTEVIEKSAQSAVTDLGDEYDVLLMSWPVSDQSALEAIRSWGSSRPIVFIGEVTDRNIPGGAGLGGCASDEFFDSIIWEREFESYTGNMLEKAGVIYWKEPGSIDRNK